MSSSSTTAKSSDKNAINVDLLVGRKMRDHYQQNFRENVSAPTSEFAKKQLEKMGWSEGTGLGKKRDGMTTHIKVKKRKDNVGLGGSDKPDVQAVLGDSEWWKDSLGSTLARLGNKKKDKKKDKKMSKKEKNHAASKKYTDEELFAATGGARFGMRAGITNNLHKWTRTENKDDQEGSSSDDAKTEEAPKSLSETATEETDAKTTDWEKKSKKRKNDNEETDLSDERAEKKNKKEKKKRRKVEEAQASDGDVKVSSSSDSESKKRRKEKKQAKKDKKSKKKE